METVLYVLAGVSTAFFVLRLILLFVGIDGGEGAADAPGLAGDLNDAGAAADFKIFTMMTAIVTLMIGSWSSLLMLGLEFSPWMALGGGYVAGFIAAVGVGYAIFSLKKLEGDGTIRDFKAEGLKGTVYMKIPEAGKGKGQVQVSVEGRLRTFDAVSDGPEIESFKPIVVMQRMDEHTLRVCPTE
ncbi:MAG: hypothetical protein KF696_13575 [Planctomycetes bacterium]|nr:hypothetical protein [Planctomycetota bacterium]MCW8137095.1 hypothetical protein [Planctomycetota bacterium]